MLGIGDYLGARMRSEHKLFLALEFDSPAKAKVALRVLQNSFPDIVKPTSRYCIGEFALRWEEVGDKPETSKALQEVNDCRAEVGLQPLDLNPLHVIPDLELDGSNEEEVSRAVRAHVAREKWQREQQARPWWSGKDVAGWLYNRGWRVSQPPKPAGMHPHDASETPLLFIPEAWIINSSHAPGTDGPILVEDAGLMSVGKPRRERCICRRTKLEHVDVRHQFQPYEDSDAT